MGFAFSALVGENSCALSTAAIRRGIRVDNSNAQEEALRARAQAEYAKLREQMRRQDGESLKGASKAARTAAPAASGSASASRPSGVGGESGGSAAQSGGSTTQSGAASAQPSDAGKPTIGSLVADLSSQASTLVRGELEYAQANLKAKVKNLGMGGVHLGVAAFIGLYATGMLFVTFALVLAIWLPVWAGFLIVTSLLLLLAGAFALLGVKKLKASQAYKVSPGDGFGKDVAAFKNGLKK